MNWRSGLLALCFALPVAASAESINPLYAKADICGRYEVFHINGILTSVAGATDNLNELRQAYGNAHDGHLIFYALAYNQTNQAPQDLIDSYNQVVFDFPGVTFADWVAAVWSSVYRGSVTAEIALIIAQRLSAIYDLERPSPYQDADLNAIVTTIRGGHAFSGRALLVPHSQGNLYANLVYDRLTAAGPQQVPAGQIGIVGVASPASSVRGGGMYVTSSNDLVINGVRFVFSNTLQANVTIPIMDTLGHHFIAVYLNPVNYVVSIEPITLAMSTVLSRLVSINSISFSYTFTGAAGASWADCRPEIGPRRYPYVCWNIWYEPVVTYSVAGVPNSITRPGSASETDGLARALTQGCVAAAASAWQTRIDTGTVSGMTANCGWHTDLANRYAGYRSADAIQDSVREWVHPYYVFGIKTADSTPVCRRAT